MTAEDWYKRFYETYKSYEKAHQKQIKKAISTDALWSASMEIILSEMAKSESYKQSGKLRGAPGVDIHWKKPGHTVAIEHENRGDKIYSEIANLCQDNSDLKVLITYASDEDFVPNLYKMASSCALDLGKNGFGKGEFLLIVGGNQEYDWEGFRFEFRAQPVPLKVGGGRIV